jgi:multidrug efflux pump subunit AcrA (membrane-fusion protein)
MGKKIIVLIAGLFVGIVTFASPKAVSKIDSKPQVAQVASVYKGVVILHVKLGQKVKKGQLLFGLNADMLKAKLENDKTNIINTTLILKRATELVEKHSISQDDYQQCVRDALAAQSSYDLNLAQIKQSEYYSPFDGTVTNIIRYDGSGLGDNDNEVEVTEGNVSVDTANRKAIVCTRWPGVLILKVALGEKVKKGQLLFSIETQDLTAQLNKDKSFLKYAIDDYKRLKILNKTHTISLLKFTEAKIRYGKALADVKIDEIMIKQSSGYAPFDGTVTSIDRYPLATIKNGLHRQL